MDGQVFRWRELTVVFAEENRKKPTDMRMRELRSVSPRDSPERSYSPSPATEGSPPYNGGSRRRSQSPVKDRSPPPYNGSRSPSPSPERARLPLMSRSPSKSRSLSLNPDPRDYPRGKPDRDGSVSP
ncbi:hypothetical protein Hanom_Chr16g01477741 [Helianthus anomalus]